MSRGDGKFSTSLPIVSNSLSAVFQAGGLIVVLVEVIRKAYLAAIVPVIVNSVLSEHQVIADIVAFVGKGDFPRSRLGDKQRGKILASWVTRKMRTIAQFNIRDPDASDAMMISVPEDRAVSVRGSTSLNERPISMSQQQQDHISRRFSAALDPNYATEQNLPYESSITESPSVDDTQIYEDLTPRNPTKEYFPTPPTASSQNERPAVPSKDYFAQPASNHDPEQTPLANPNNTRQQQQYNNYDGPIHDDYSTEPAYTKQPRTTTTNTTTTRVLGSRQFSSSTFTAYNPGVASSNGALSKVRPPPEPPRNASLRTPSGRGGLRVTNTSDEGEEPWPQEAISAMRRYGS